MCGIFGCSLKKGANKKAALAKFKILGLYNIKRGRDASGIYINGEIKKSIKEFDDFLEDIVIKDNYKNNIILGHNRAGSMGYKKTIEEAHPFLINENLVFTHNGTIKNTFQLCKEYNVVETDFNVDSNLLGTLLYTEGSEVLTKYKGAAALAYTYLDDPDVLYLFHGQSKDYKHGSCLEERPLYFMETKDGVFYSSLEESLKAIRISEEEIPYNLEYNVIFKIKDGEFLDEEHELIEREETNVTVHYSTPVKYNNVHDIFQKNLLDNSLNSAIKSSFDLSLILKESFPQKLIESAKTDFKLYNGNFIYFHRGRYWESPRNLITKPLYVKKGGLITDENDSSGTLLFFYKGVLLKDEAAYRELLSIKNELVSTNWLVDPKTCNFPLLMSKYSQYPVYSLPEEKNNVMSTFYANSWYLEGDEKKAYSFTPKFGGRNYTIKNGILMDIKSSHREKCILENEKNVEMQFENLKKIGIQGGDSSSESPFQKKTIFLWFFEKVYETLKDLLDDWKNDEWEAFRTYVKVAWKRDYSVDLLESEVTESCQYIIDSAIRHNVSVSHIINNGSSEDSELLLKIYNEILDDKRTFKITPSILQEHSLIEKIAEEIEMIEEEEIEEEEEVDEEKEEIFDSIENSIILLDDLQRSSFELMSYDDSDSAQKIASILITGVANIISNLKEPLKEYNEADLIKQLKEVEETKNIEHGIL